MFSRSAVVLAKKAHSPFARFLGRVGSSVHKTHGVRPMNITAALWTLTTPKYKKVDSSARAEEALRIYKKKGFAVVQQARAMKRSQTGKSIRVKTSTKSSAKKRKSGASRRRRATRKASRTVKRRKAQAKRKSVQKKRKTTAAKKSGKKGARSFKAFRRAVTTSKLSTLERTALRASYLSTAALPPKAAVAAGKRALADVRSTKKVDEKAKKTTSRRRRVASKRSTRSRRVSGAKRSPRVAKKKKPASKKPKKAASKKKASKKVKRVGKAKTSPAASYNRFRQEVMRRAGLPATKASNIRVQRLWFLTSSQRTLTPKARIDMAVGLLRKSSAQRRRPAKAKKVAVRRNRNRTSGKASKKAKKSKKSKKSKTTTKPKKSTKSTKSRRAVKPTKQVAKPKKPASKRSRRHNPYLRFYREMVLTGAIPNHPHGARTRKIKELWAATHQLKTTQARINLGRAYATGAIPMPGAPVPKKAPTVAVQKPRAAKTEVKKVAKAAPRVQRPKKQRSSATVNFSVPARYHKNPFGAAYSVLRPYVAGSTSDAKMHNLSVAWGKSAFPENVKDNRTPQQRIRAAANVMKRA